MTALQHFGSNETLLLIENSMFKLYFVGKTRNRKFDIINTNNNIKGYLFIEYPYAQIVKTINVLGELEENSFNSMRPSFFEDSNYQIILEPKTNDSFRIYHIDKEIRESFIEVGNNLYGNIVFNGEIGYTTFKVLSNDNELMKLTIEIFPSKLDYVKDYKEILSEVNEEISSLVFDFLGKTFQRANLVDVNNQTGVEFTEILIQIYNNFNKALEYIENHPKHDIVRSENIHQANKSKVISRATVNYIRKKSHLLYPHEKGIININHNKYLPLKVIEKKSDITYDIYENQYVKHIIKMIIHRIRSVKQNISLIYKIDNYYYEALNKLENNLNKHLQGFFSKISDVNVKQNITLSFKMTQGYREIFFNFMMLKKGLDITEGLYKITPKKIWNLYEIWCYLKIHNILNRLGFSTVHNGIIETTDNGISLSLTTNKTSKITYSNSTGKNIELWYNRTYSYLPTTSQRPDTVLCLRNLDKNDRIYIFDAKYRLKIDSENIVGPMEEDINVMHRYRDAIVSELDEKLQFKYNTFGAYVMFPYSDEVSFKKHKYFKSIEKVNIGAFPMLPGSTSLIENHINKIVNESYIESIANLPTYEEDDDNLKFKHSNVMVVNVPTKEHLASYLKNHFFHIPLVKLSNVRLGVQYIAFYQPKNIFKEDAGIYYFAKIRDVRKYKRNECKELPVIKGNPEKEYLRFELEDFEKVGPIQTVEYGVELITYTTMYLLKNAETLHELHFKNRLEIELYKILKRISFSKNIKLIRRSDHFLINTTKIEIKNRKFLAIDETLVSWNNLEEELLNRIFRSNDYICR
ncbi:hypothetical protein SAMN02745120_1654 [Acetoanaerobium noterae]|uniref:DUF2357 domain-containing protein n=1 Tax=Acetoanaerobium noterae TaxID=745369 RepID=A0A1T5BJ13_9FIRM|nr:DUF2357 domain-containing protein [Acetoanaerobium noterae]SKB47145.1 hypothetical protein SAMN02745120_1654 [Acetoanaerobium noterae]